MQQNELLRVENLKQYFNPAGDYIVKAVDDVSFSIKKGEVFSLVGESGSGKSTVARSIMNIYPLTSGRIYFKDRLISKKKIEKNIKEDISKNIKMIFQDSAVALNPRMKVKDIIAEPVFACKMCKNKKEVYEKVIHTMKYVGLGDEYLDKRPCQLSGGQRQRVSIARSTIAHPDLIIADEPVASLDVSIQAQIINLFMHMKQNHDHAFLFIAHDLSLVRYISDKVAVMYRGKIVEKGETEKVFQNPVHGYTKSLLSAIPIPNPKTEKNKKFLPYIPPENFSNGSMVEVEDGHFVYETV